jgi:hypothetical protein
MPAYVDEFYTGLPEDGELFIAPSAVYTYPLSSFRRKRVSKSTL